MTQFLNFLPSPATTPQRSFQQLILSHVQSKDRDWWHHRKPFDRLELLRVPRIRLSFNHLKHNSNKSLRINWIRQPTAFYSFSSSNRWSWRTPRLSWTCAIPYRTRISSTIITTTSNCAMATITIAWICRMQLQDHSKFTVSQVIGNVLSTLFVFQLKLVWPKNKVRTKKKRCPATDTFLISY